MHVCTHVPSDGTILNMGYDHTRAMEDQNKLQTEQNTKQSKQVRRVEQPDYAARAARGALETLPEEPCL